jgi:hypothetical protein
VAERCGRGGGSAVGSRVPGVVECGRSPGMEVGLDGRRARRRH